MATETLDDYTVTNDYTDAVVTVTGLASVAATIQNIGSTAIAVVSQPSGTTPTTKTGVILRSGEVWPVNAAQVWVKAIGGSSGKISISKT